MLTTPTGTVVMLGFTARTTRTGKLGDLGDPARVFCQSESR
jgi:hypothetical protein